MCDGPSCRGRGRGRGRGRRCRSLLGRCSRARAKHRLGLGRAWCLILCVGWSRTTRYVGTDGGPKAVEGALEGRTFSQRAGVRAALRDTGTRAQPMCSGHRRAASQLRVSRMRSRVRWLAPRGAAVTRAPLQWTGAGCGGGRQVLLVAAALVRMVGGGGGGSGASAAASFATRYSTGHAIAGERGAVVGHAASLCLYLCLCLLQCQSQCQSRSQLPASSLPFSLSMCVLLSLSGALFVADGRSDQIRSA